MSYIYYYKVPFLKGMKVYSHKPKLNLIILPASRPIF